MHSITDKSNNHVGYFYSNMIISLNDEVIGVVLGDCVFSKGETLGKIINNKLHHTNGKIIGLLGSGDEHKQIDEISFHSKAWAIISSIKNHSCHWIEEKEEWDNSAFSQHFN